MTFYLCALEFVRWHLEFGPSNKAKATNQPTTDNALSYSIYAYSSLYPHESN